MTLKSIIFLTIIFGLMSFTDIKDIRLPFPAHFPNPTFDFQKTPLDSTKILLGRILFYDPILSKDNSISCASCHSPYNAFAHTDHDLSHGIFDAIGTRNAPALFNLAWQKEFMWDGAINHIDMQALAYSMPLAPEMRPLYLIWPGRRNLCGTEPSTILTCRHWRPYLILAQWVVVSMR